MLREVDLNKSETSFCILFETYCLVYMVFYISMFVLHLNLILLTLISFTSQSLFKIVLYSHTKETTLNANDCVI